MRHNNTERIAIYAIGKVIESDLGWIFREQPIVDVGIDALIEQSINGNPTGKFLATQIKSGEKNFHFSKNKYTYYVSLTHYHYWLNLDIPIIMIIFLPKNEEILWESISKKTLKKSKLRWKLDILESKKLDKNSKEEFVTLFNSTQKRNMNFATLVDDISDETIHDIVEKVKNLKYARTSIEKMSEILIDLNAEVNDSTKRFIEFAILGYDDNYPEVLAVLKNISRIMDITATRLLSEINVFASTSASGFTALDQVNTMYFKLTLENKIIDEFTALIKPLLQSYDVAISGMNAMSEGVKKLPEKYKYLKKSKDNYLITTQIIIEELELSKNMWESALYKFNNMTV